jgi:7-keto-8-aminopelargonate synthetase-like enzyme
MQKWGRGNVESRKGEEKKSHSHRTMNSTSLQHTDCCLRDFKRRKQWCGEGKWDILRLHLGPNLSAMVKDQQLCNLNVSHIRLAAIAHQGANLRLKASASHTEAEKSTELGENISIKSFFGKCETH